MRTPTQALIDAVDFAGGQTGFAKRLTEVMAREVSQQQVWGWLNRGQKTIPPGYAPAVEKATRGRIKRHELRPDFFLTPERAA